MARTLGPKDIIKMITIAFLVGLIVLIFAKFSKGFRYDVESNLKSNEYYYPAVR